MIDWFSFYEWVRSLFGFSLERDIKAAHLLASKLTPRTVDVAEGRLRELVNGADVAVVGAGPNLDSEIEDERLRELVIVAADGATTALLRRGLVPHVIVTDLDGRIEDQIRANNQYGSILLIHAHGDNIDTLEASLTLFKGSLIGTCQVAPPPPLRVYGGFTDGDRALFTALRFSPRSVRLVGWSFDGTVGWASKPHYDGAVVAVGRKRLKLVIAEFMVKVAMELYPGVVRWGLG